MLRDEEEESAVVVLDDDDDVVGFPILGALCNADGAAPKGHGRCGKR